MKTTRLLPVLLMLVAVMFSCDKPQPEALSLLEQAEQMIEVDLDSALVLIDSIYYPEKSFNTEDYLRYHLVRVQARHKNFLPITEDTIIFDVKNFYLNHSNDPEKTALACYYCGWLHRERGDLNLAMLEYKEAKHHAENTGNTSFNALIQFNIGALFREHGLYSEGLENYIIAEQLYRQSPEGYRDKRVNCYSEIGQMYMLLGNQDSAFVYFHKGLDLAESINSKDLQRLLFQNLSVAYAEIKRYEEAGDFLHKSIELIENEKELPRYYLNFSRLYQKTGKSDSLSFYADKLIQSVDSSSDLYFKISAYHFLAEYAKDNN